VREGRRAKESTHSGVDLRSASPRSPEFLNERVSPDRESPSSIHLLRFSLDLGAGALNGAARYLP